MPLRFLVLGPLEVWEDDRELPLGAGRQRALLAAVPRSDGTRSDVVRELHRTNERGGILGALRFGRNGDPVTAAVTILRGVAHGGLTEFPYENAVVDRVITPPPATIHP